MDPNEVKDMLWKWWIDHDQNEELRCLFEKVEDCINFLCFDLDEAYDEIDRLKNNE